MNADEAKKKLASQALTLPLQNTNVEAHSV